MNSDKRKSLLTLAGVGVIASVDSQWVKPVVNCIVLPAHAATSSGVCSGFVTESVSGVITVEVSDTQVIGPVAASRNINAFAVTVNQVVNPVGLSVSEVDQRTVFSGSIDASTNQISGELSVLQTCDGQFVCEQLTTFVVDLIGAPMANAVGQYQGQLSGTLRCCQDFF